ncbi:hypothetical protein [Nocardia salmonicida]|uniref:hypothetical protein n=1 Tax=Nocardia salmonicida TaxID=53431 RepID=UPI0037BE1F9B
MDQGVSEKVLDLSTRHLAAAVVLGAEYLFAGEQVAAAQLAALAADDLAEGGVLVVLTRCTHTSDGAVIDPTGPVVTAGQNADLLYLGHIVAVPITDDTITGPPRCVHKQSPSAPRHRKAHADVLVFLQPRTAA